MNFLALHDDVKFIIATHLASDLKIRAMLSKNHDLQQILFGDVVYNDDLNHYINLQYNAKENDDFNNAKILKIYQDLSIHTYVCIQIICIYIYRYITHHTRALVSPTQPSARTNPSRASSSSCTPPVALCCDTHAFKPALEPFLRPSNVSPPSPASALCRLLRARPVFFFGLIPRPFKKSMASLRAITASFSWSMQNMKEIKIKFINE